MRIVLSNVIAIYQRELHAYFASPLSYVIAVVFWLLGAVFLVNILFNPENGIIPQVAVLDQYGGGAPVDVADEFMKAFLNSLGSLSLFILPILSMGLYADERKRGTLELLATSPLTNWAVAVGKLLAVSTFYVALLLPLMVMASIPLGSADPPISMAGFFLGYGGLLLLVCAVLALGMFVSSLTDSTVLAAILTFALILVLWIIDAIAPALPDQLGAAIAHLSMLKHFNDLTQGILDFSSVVLFGSYIVLGIFLTAQSVDALRFQRS